MHVFCTIYGARNSHGWNRLLSGFRDLFPGKPSLVLTYLLRTLATNLFKFTYISL